jgi:hypothetical protein
VYYRVQPSATAATEVMPLGSKPSGALPRFSVYTFGVTNQQEFGCAL